MELPNLEIDLRSRIFAIRGKVRRTRSSDMFFCKKNLLPNMLPTVSEPKVLLTFATRTWDESSAWGVATPSVPHRAVMGAHRLQGHPRLPGNTYKTAPNARPHHIRSNVLYVSLTDHG